MASCFLVASLTFFPSSSPSWCEVLTYIEVWSPSNIVVLNGKFAKLGRQVLGLALYSLALIMALRFEYAGLKELCRAVVEGAELSHRYVTWVAGPVLYLQGWSSLAPSTISGQYFWSRLPGRKHILHPSESTSSWSTEPCDPHWQVYHRLWHFLHFENFTSVWFVRRWRQREHSPLSPSRHCWLPKLLTWGSFQVELSRPKLAKNDISCWQKKCCQLTDP